MTLTVMLPYYYRVVGLGHLVEHDPSLKSVLDLSPNEEAERIAVGERWIRTNLEPQ